MYLGYYCPSPVQDLVIGNVHRGKILKKLTKASKPTHRFGFDENGRLRTVSDPQRETDKVCEGNFLDYREDQVVITGFRTYDKFPESLAICEYNEKGLITKYTLGLLLHGRCDEIQQETYYYSDDGQMQTADFRYCMNNRDHISDMDADGSAKKLLRDMVNMEGMKDMNGNTIVIPDIIINKDYYILHHNEEGYLTGFEAVGDPVWAGHIFEIAKGKQRKV